MTTYVSIPNGDITAGQPVTQELVTALRDNPTAITEGSSGAPKIQGAALDTGIIGQTNIDWANAAGLTPFLWTNPNIADINDTSSYVTQGTFMLYVPSAASTFNYRFDGTFSGTGSAYARVESPTATGSTTTFTGTLDGWDAEIETVDISSDSGWTLMSVKAYTSTTANNFTIRQIAAYLS